MELGNPGKIRKEVTVVKIAMQAIEDEVEEDVLNATKKDLENRTIERENDSVVINGGVYSTRAFSIKEYELDEKRLDDWWTDFVG